MADNISLFVAQCNDVAEMRNQLLSFNKNDVNAARKAIQNVTLLRVYHQLERIVRYTEMIDKIEDRIYQSIDAKLANSDPDDDSMWLTLIPMVKHLQHTMIESHKLLEPYLSMEQLAALDVPKEDPTNSFTSMILDQESREKVRTGVQSLLAVINTFDSIGTETEEKNKVQSKALEVLASLDAPKEEEPTNA